MSEQVVLLDGDGRAIGTADKATVHHGDTPRHLAFSAYLFDPDGALLVSQRAVDKLTFPGLWTNSACGHPAPGEAPDAAVRRRVRQELGVSIGELRLVLPEFAYVARMHGVVENEWCPVYAGWLPDRALAVDAGEVGGTEWVAWGTFVAEVLAGRRSVSPWCVDQVRGLDALGPDPLRWPAGDPALLPPAARFVS